MRHSKADPTSPRCSLCSLLSLSCSLLWHPWLSALLAAVFSWNPWPFPWDTPWSLPRQPNILAHGLSCLTSGLKFWFQVFIPKKSWEKWLVPCAEPHMLLLWMLDFGTAGRNRTAGNPKIPQQAGKGLKSHPVPTPAKIRDTFPTREIPIKLPGDEKPV